MATHGTTMNVEEAENEKYKIKSVKLKTGHVMKYICQGQNGPCPLIGIANVLLLRGSIELSETARSIRFEELVALVADRIMTMNADAPDEETRLNLEANIATAISMLPRLRVGLDVNVRFRRPTDFEYTEECVVFDLLNIRLLHGWLVDPQNVEAARVIGGKSYNQVVELVINASDATAATAPPAASHDSADVDDDVDNDDGGSVPSEASGASSIDVEQLAHDGLVAQTFLQETAAQLTFHGVVELISAVRENEFAVFFRNNHFSALTKHDGQLFLLVTDLGYRKEAVVWERLDDVTGDVEFLTADFERFTGQELDTGIKPRKGATEDADREMALRLQREENRAAAREDDGHGGGGQRRPHTANSSPARGDPNAPMDPRRPRRNSDRGHRNDDDDTKKGCHIM